MTFFYEHKPTPIFEVKSIIKDKLRMLTEGGYTRNSRYASDEDYYTTLNKVKYYTETYGNDEYFQNVESGQHVASAIVNIEGFVKITTNIAKAGDLRAHGLSSSMKENPNYLTFRLNAGRGIEHPDTFTPNIQPAQTRPDIDNIKYFPLPDGVTLSNGENKIKVGLLKPGSPMSDGAIKTYIIYGQEILSFVEKNMKNPIGYKDGKGSELANTGMDLGTKFKMIRKNLQLLLKMPTISKSVWDDFSLGFERTYGEPITNVNLTKHLSTEDDWNEVLKKANLKTKSINSDEDAYNEKLAAMAALKAKHRR
jgi:hypothetical protein